MKESMGAMNNEARSTIRGLIFDSGGVLIRTVTPTPRRDLERRYGLPEGGVDALVFDHALWQEAQLGHITSAEFWERIGQELGLGAGETAEFRQAFWSGDRLDSELLGLIQALHGAGYRTGLLSNAPADFRQSVDQMMPGTFEPVVVSGCEGMMKPSPEIFALTLERAGLRPEETVFVDDFRENVTAACRLGMHGLWFRGAAPLRRDLRALGLPAPDPVIASVEGIRAVIFDWSGVMERSADSTYCAQWEQRLNVAPGTLPGVLWGAECHLLEVGAISLDEFGEHVARRLNLTSPEAGRKFVDEFYTTDWLNDSVVAAARALRSRYKTALLSNAFPGQPEWLRDQYDLDLEAEFDVYINSAEVGLRKPDPAIYTLTLDRLGLAPEEAVLLDDMLRNVDVAHALGMHALQFVDPTISLPQLEALLGHKIGGNPAD
ncbi:MAG: HAD family phosphatase [Anaerolineales bacterium]|nr:HAD family phosphatase [Anaerolineales bacterium]